MQPMCTQDASVLRQASVPWAPSPRAQFQGTQLLRGAQGCLPVHPYCLSTCPSISPTPGIFLPCRLVFSLQSCTT
jgi:hypothetical protein